MFCRVVILVFLVLSSKEVLSQEATDIAFPSPNASSLGEYGDVPVSEYTGIPNITVPLYETNVAGNPFVISVSYHAQGIRVNEIASSVGQDWSLNAGGAITRIIRGKADESTDGFWDSGYAIRNYDEINDFTEQQKLDIIDGNFDTNPDVFRFNFMGKVGKFIYRPTGSSTGEFVSIPLNDYKITFSKSGIFIETWTIVDEAGVEYHFTEKEVSTSIDKENGNGTIVAEGPTAWYLTSVIFPEGKQITFEYSSPVQIINYDEIVYKEKVEFPTGATYESKIQNKTYTVYLSKITTDKEEIIFNRASRNDHEYEKRYSNIEIRRNNERVQKIVFNHSYWVNGSEFHQKRLKLDGLSIEGSTSSNPQQYQFEYNSGHVPSRDSYATDHWGFYNGKNLNNDILPQIEVPFPSGHPSSHVILELTGANKDPDPTYSGNGLLKKIIYPTGGYTEFEYEGNTYGYRSNEQLEILSDIGTNLTLSVVTEAQGSVYSDSETTVFSVPTTQYSEINFSYVPVFNMPQGAVARNTDIRVRLVDEANNVLYEEEAIIPDDSNPPSPPYSFEPTLVLLQENVTYTLEIEARGDYDQGNVNITYYNQLASIQEKKGGGNRVKRIKRHDGISAANDIIKTYHYQDFNDNARSSGAVISEPLYYHWIVDPNQYAITYLIRYSTSSSLTGPQGVHVGYNNIKVTYGESENKGYSLLTFDGIQNLPPFSPAYAPFAVIDTYDWDVGQLLKKEDYNESHNLIQSKLYNYYYNELYKVRGVASKRLLSVLMYDQNMNPVSNNIFTVAFFDHSTANKRLKNSTTRVYNSEANNLETAVAYEYVGSAQVLLANKTESNANGEERITEYEYAHEQYSGMASKNMFIQPYSVTVKDGNGTVLSKNWTLWKDWGGGRWLPCGVWAWNGGATTPPANCSSN